MVDRRAYRSVGDIPSHSPEEDDTTYHREGYEGDGPEGHLAGRGVDVVPTSIPGAARGAADEGGPYRGLGPRNYRRSDELIYDEVCERLLEDPRVDARGLDVDCRDGVVRLTGHLADVDQLRRALHVVDTVPGVKELEDRVHVG